MVELRALQKYSGWSTLLGIDPTSLGKFCQVKISDRSRVSQSPPATTTLFAVEGFNRKLVVNPAVTETDYFDVDPNDAITEYNITLRISDGEYKSDTMVTLHVDDVNDNAPVINAISPIIISEGLPAGGVVHAFVVTDADRDAPNNVVSLQLQGTNSEHFIIRDKFLYVASPSLLDYGTVRDYSLILIAEDGAPDDEKLSSNTTFTIALETAPTFSSSLYSASVQEDIAQSGQVIAVTATDEDGGNLTFSISGNQTLFAMSGPNLTIATYADLAKLDVDTGPKQFALDVIVTDGKYSATTVVSVTVTDVNDLAPVFKQADYATAINQNTQSGTTLLTVTATDGDSSSQNNGVTYFLKGTDSDHFEIGSASGVVVVADPARLDYSSRNRYSLEVTAKDTGTSAKKATVPLIVTIETTPVFIAPPPAGDSLELAEDQAAAEGVFTFNATDEDGSTLVYRLVQITPSNTALFEIVGNQLKTKSTIDSTSLDVDSDSAERQYTVHVRVFDGKYSADSNLTITIIDVNDNQPTFDSSSRSLNVLENATGVVTTVTASDNDYSVPNNVIQYAITAGNNEANFMLDASNGSLSVVKLLKFPQYKLTIRATDGGTPPQMGKLTLTINVIEHIDECETSPCKNGATCRRNLNYYFCDCVNGWEGTDCGFNTDDCDPNPCQNAGVCQDGVASYQCSCAKGWTGINCTNACAGHTYGWNCNETCSCTLAKLEESATDQHCNIETGDCFCNEHWTGKTCSEDAAECAQKTGLCTSANQACEDTIGSYECVCQTGYTVNGSACVLDDSVNNPTILHVSVLQNPTGNGSMQLFLAVILDLATCPALHVPSVYRRIKADLEQQMQMKTGPKTVVYNISCGSLIYNTFMEVNASTDLLALSEKLQVFRKNGSLRVENTYASVTGLNINGDQVSASPSVCSIYKSLSQCGPDYTCEMTDGRPVCRAKEKDNTDLILGLGLGVGCGVIAIVLVGLLGYRCFRPRQERIVRAKSGYSASEGPHKSDSHHSYIKPHPKWYDERPYRFTGDSYLYNGRY